MLCYPAPLATIHPTAIVDPAVELGDDVVVGPACVVDGPAVIGSGCRLISHVCLSGKVVLGEANTLYPFVCVGFEAQHLTHKGGSGGVVIGNHNVLRESVTIHRSIDAAQPTTLGDNNYMMTCAHAGHDAQVGDRCTLASGALLGGHVQIADDVFVGGNAAVHQHCRVGRFSLLGGNSTATQDLPPFMMMTHVNQVISVNRIGLRRAGIARDAIDAIKDAFNILYCQGHATATAADHIEQARTPDHPGAGLLAELAAFIRVTNRGICRYHRSKRSESSKA